jgi:hypothetical protein
VETLFKVLLAAGLIASEEAAVANKAKILAVADAMAITLASHGAQLADAAITNANFGVFLNPFKPAFVNGVNQSFGNLAAEGETEADTLFPLMVVAAQNYVKSFSS